VRDRDFITYFLALDQDPPFNIEKAKADLQDHYNENYANKSSTTQSHNKPTMPASTCHQAPTFVNLTAWYEKKQQLVNELEQYFELPKENYSACQPLKWWVGRQAQFPNLFCLVCNIFSIPSRLTHMFIVFSFD
jgi:hypothetical protein